MESAAVASAATAACGTGVEAGACGGSPESQPSRGAPKQLVRQKHQEWRTIPDGAPMGMVTVQSMGGCGGSPEPQAMRGASKGVETRSIKKEWCIKRCGDMKHQKEWCIKGNGTLKETVT
eukprot:1160827-Pelagomonas_calceolata.AAC.20